eukprot:TRINITY_DN7936_c0_g1_i3.p1 TRINITY_DN7936_c0_g1~~TRINITY_DN7936_c0_g1_i3.p1  ORF type:complete len:247 (+),score=-25.28 TRINITY_DN7936_c0_g1_i3:497-1237(+)
MIYRIVSTFLKCNSSKPTFLRIRGQNLSTLPKNFYIHKLTNQKNQQSHSKQHFNGTQILLVVKSNNELFKLQKIHYTYNINQRAGYKISCLLYHPKLGDMAFCIVSDFNISVILLMLESVINHSSKNQTSPYYTKQVLNQKFNKFATYYLTYKSNDFLIYKASQAQTYHYLPSKIDIIQLKLNNRTNKRCSKLECSQQKPSNTTQSKWINSILPKLNDVILLLYTVHSYSRDVQTQNTMYFCKLIY